MHLFTTFVVLGVIAISTEARTPIGELLTVCSKSDPNVAACATKSANEFLPQMVKGIPDFDFPPVDPLKVPFLDLSSKDKPDGLNLKVSDTTHRGMKEMKFTDMRFDFAKGYFEIDAFFPTYEVTGTCESSGKVLLLPIQGHGPCNITTKDSVVTMKIHAGPETRDGKAYFKTGKFEIDLDIGKAYISMDGLFGGDKQLADSMNKFLDDNALEVLNEMKPTLKLVWANLFQTLMEKINKDTPIPELFHD